MEANSAYFLPYVQTGYFVEGYKEPLTVGVYHELISAFLKKNKISNFAYLTAHNPKSKLLTPKTNNRRNKKLEADLLSLGYPFLKGQGIAGMGIELLFRHEETEKDHWPPEDSFFIMGITLDETVVLAQKYRQIAFLYGDDTGCPDLCFSEQYKLENGKITTIQIW